MYLNRSVHKGCGFPTTSALGSGHGIESEIDSELGINEGGGLGYQPTKGGVEASREFVEEEEEEEEDVEAETDSLSLALLLSDVETASIVSIRLSQKYDYNLILLANQSNIFL